MRHRLAFALVILCVAPAAALDLPARKAGLWEMTMTFEGRGMPPQVSQHCIDAETDKQMSAIGSGMQKDMCSKQDISRVGSTIVIASVCKVGPMTMTSHAVVSGDFNSAYTVKSTSKQDGGPTLPGMPASTSMTIEAKWTGACKADQKPGDIIMAGGRKMNIRDLQSMQGMGSAPPPAR
jgi:hypothetical protein